MLVPAIKLVEAADAHEKIASHFTPVGSQIAHHALTFSIAMSYVSY